MQQESNTLTRKGRRLWIPSDGATFPARCIVTGETSDLVWIDADLDALVNPKLAKAVLKPMAVAGAATAAAAGKFKTAYRTALALTSGALDSKDVPKVKFAVHEPYYKKWFNGFVKRRKRRWQFLGVGAALAVISFVGMCAGAFALPGDTAVNIFLPMLLVSIVLMVTGVLYSFFAAQPLLHSADVREHYVTVLGASEEFLEHVPEKY